ncbi:MAG: hypothetical protein MHM6MM_006510 [Cercozoa sp. M6MM]
MEYHTTMLLGVFATLGLMFAQWGLPGLAGVIHPVLQKQAATTTGLFAASARMAHPSLQSIADAGVSTATCLITILAFVFGALRLIP